MTDFKQALEWLSEGKKVRRRCWCYFYYIIWDSEEKLGSKSGEILGEFVDQDGRVVSWWTIEIFRGTDWELYDPNAKKLLTTVLEKKKATAVVKKR